jgi:hypothetical protein
MTEPPVEDDKVVAFVQLYVVAPLAVILAAEPEQMLFAVEETVINGVGFTLTVTMALLVQAPVVPVTV